MTHGVDGIPGPHDDDVDEFTRQREELNKSSRDKNRDEISFMEALDKARKSELLEFCPLNQIAVDVFYGERSEFLKKYADAWLHADVWNKRLMKPVFQAFIRTYNLEEDPAGDGPREPAANP